MCSEDGIGPGPKIIVAIQDGPMTKVFTGIVLDGSITIDTETIDAEYLSMTHVIPTGRRTAKIEVEFVLQDYGAQMKTWADIKDPEEIEAGRRGIEPTK